MAQPVHIPVMINEVLLGLRVQPGGRYVDCTLGAGGHAAAVLEQSQPGGQLLGIDADPTALGIARDGLARYDGSFVLVNDNFSHLQAVCEQHGFAPVHGVLFDLGLGSFQIDVAARGFSFLQDAPLDMRVSPSQEMTAADIVNSYDETELANLIWKYGEEPGSRRIARAIVRRRPIETTSQLAAVVAGALGGRHGKTHPATRTFQALRIAVNSELENLESALGQAIAVLGSEGRLVLISYHSLEDRIVKQFLRREASGCICPPGTMSCVCGHTPTVKLITKKVIVPAQSEIRSNPRSRSARMRVAERVLNDEEHKELVKRLLASGVPTGGQSRRPDSMSMVVRRERTKMGARRRVLV
jgi:16S rRNA (cytosine1402-N4)-methyltransferase